MTNTHDNRELARLYLHAWNSGNLGLLDTLIAPGYVNHSPAGPPPPPGPEGLKPIVAAMRQGFPDLRYEIEHLVAGGDLVAVHTIVTGTNTGELFGAPPTGRAMRVRQMQIERIEDGLIAEHWRLTDETTQRAQLNGVSA